MEFQEETYTPPTRVTKAMVEQFIADEVGWHVYDLQFQKVEELTPDWKHACAIAGVTYLPVIHIHLDEVAVRYVICVDCGKVYYEYEK